MFFFQVRGLRAGWTHCNVSGLYIPNIIIYDVIARLALGFLYSLSTVSQVRCFPGATDKQIQISSTNTANVIQGYVFYFRAC